MLFMTSQTVKCNEFHNVIENSKFEFLAVTKFLSKEGCLAKEMQDRLCAINGDRAPSLYSD